MAISSGVAPHFAWINGLLIEHGSVTQINTNAQSVFSVSLPMDTASALSGTQATIVVQNVAGTGTLYTGPILSIANDLTNRTVGITGAAGLGLVAVKVSKSYVDTPGSAIAQDVCGIAGYPCVASAVGLAAGKKMMDQFVKILDSVSPAYAMSKLSEMDTARWRVDPFGTVHYEPREGTGASNYVVNYRAPTLQSPEVSDAINLTVNENLLASGTGPTEVLSWNTEDKDVYHGNAPGLNNTWDNRLHIPQLDQAHAQSYADSLQELISRRSLSVIALVVGDPNIDPGGKLTLQGTGRFDKSYTIDEVHHQFGMSGYTMRITAYTSSAT